VGLVVNPSSASTLATSPSSAEVISHLAKAAKGEGYATPDTFSACRGGMHCLHHVNLTPVNVRGRRRSYLLFAMANADPRHYTQKIQKRLIETIDHLRADIHEVDEPQLKAMFETSAEVLGGLVKAFRDFEQKSEPAWR
jgi:hypothetical protein